MSAPEHFFDTNILLHSLSSDASKAVRVEAALAASGAISVHALNEFASEKTLLVRNPLRPRHVRELRQTSWFNMQKMGDINA